MKTIKFLTITAITCLFLMTNVTAQTLDNGIANEDLAINKNTYRTAIGLRAGGTSGLTIKQFVGYQGALEGIVGIWPDALSVTVLYEYHVSSGVPALNWYYGLGGHAAFESGRIYYVGEDPRQTDGDVGLGVDGILGIEYKIPPIPFAVSLDLKPFVEVNTDGAAFIAIDPGLGIKVAF